MSGLRNVVSNPERSIVPPKHAVSNIRLPIGQQNNAELKRQREAYLSGELKPVWELERRELEKERALIISLLPQSIIKAVHMYLEGYPLTAAFREYKIALPKSDHSRQLFRRYIDLSVQAMNHDLRLQITYNRSLWLEDQIEILDKSLARKAKRIDDGSEVRYVRSDNLSIANKAQDTLAKALGFYEPEDSRHHVENQQNNTVNITKIDINMSQQDATKLYRKALHDNE